MLSASQAASLRFAQQRRFPQILQASMDVFGALDGSEDVKAATAPLAPNADPFDVAAESYAHDLLQFLHADHAALQKIRAEAVADADKLQARLTELLAKGPLAAPVQQQRAAAATGGADSKQMVKDGVGASSSSSSSSSSSTATVTQKGDGAKKRGSSNNNSSGGGKPKKRTGRARQQGAGGTTKRASRSANSKASVSRKRRPRKPAPSSSLSSSSSAGSSSAHGSSSDDDDSDDTTWSASSGDRGGRGGGYKPASKRPWIAILTAKGEMSKSKRTVAQQHLKLFDEVDKFIQGGGASKEDDDV